MLQFGASLTYNTSSVNYDRNMFIIQATDHIWNQKVLREMTEKIQNLLLGKNTPAYFGNKEKYFHY